MDNLQQKLFVDDIYGALHAGVLVLGGPKAVGKRMRPELPADDAGKWLSKCLSRGRAEKLDLDQLLLLLSWMREAGCHVAMDQVASETGYECRPIEPEDERAKLMREFVNAQKSLAGLAARMERAGLLKAVA